MAQEKGVPESGNGGGDGRKKPARANARVQAGTAGGVAPVEDKGNGADRRSGDKGRRPKGTNATQPQVPMQSELLPDSFSRGVLTCTKGPEEGLQLTLIEGVYTIGRARENNFVLKDIAASRKHIRIEVESGVVRLVDLGSGNGTKLNGRKVSKADLQTGDKIELGSSTLVFTASNDARGTGTGQSALQQDPEPLDESRQQILAAAERLAAELSQRMNPSGVDDTNMRDTHLRDRDRGRESEMGMGTGSRSSSLRGGGELWSETGHVPLSEIVPASEPLRGARPQTLAGQSTVEKKPRIERPVRQVRPAVVPEAPLEVQASPLTSALLAAFVVFVLGGVVLGAYWWFVVRDGGPLSGREGQQGDYETAMYRAEAAVKREDWPEAYRYASDAYALKPDGLTKVYLDNIRTRLEGGIKADAPVEAQPLDDKPRDDKPRTDEPPPVEAKPLADVKPEPLPRLSDTPQREPRLELREPKLDVKPEVKPEPPAPKKAKRLTEDQAQDAFEEAVEALKQKDTKIGCKLLERVRTRAPEQSVWRGKAESLHGRRCE